MPVTCRRETVKTVEERSGQFDTHINVGVNESGSVTLSGTGSFSAPVSGEEMSLVTSSPTKEGLLRPEWQQYLGSEILTASLMRWVVQPEVCWEF